MKIEKMQTIKKLVSPIPSSPYGWKMTSEKKRNTIVANLVAHREYILNLDLNTIIEGELYDIETTNSSQMFTALRSIKEVMMEKYIELKNS